MADPFKIDGPTTLSVSGGRTSMYMLHRTLEANGGLPADAIACFANTGKEDEATLVFVQECSERWGVPITWLEYQFDEPRFRVVDFDRASRNGEPFEALVARRKFLPNVISRFCTVELKVRTMHRYLKSIGWTEWESWLGIRADEPRRLARIAKNDYGKHEEKYAPLGVAGVVAKDVGNFWKSQPFDLGLPNINGVTMHGNCDLCYLKPAAQVFSLIAEKPERAVWWAHADDSRCCPHLRSDDDGSCRPDCTPHGCIRGRREGMTTEVYVTLPVELPASLLKAVREHPTTSYEDRDEMNQRIGWLLCAWDVLIEAEHMRQIEKARLLREKGE